MIIIITTKDKSVRIFMKMRAMPHILPNFAYINIRMNSRYFPREGAFYLWLLIRRCRKVKEAKTRIAEWPK
jgi:hypothetical protein